MTRNTLSILFCSFLLANACAPAQNAEGSEVEALDSDAGIGVDADDEKSRYYWVGYDKGILRFRCYAGTFENAYAMSAGAWVTGEGMNGSDHTRFYVTYKREPGRGNRIRLEARNCSYLTYTDSPYNH